ncbi:MAG: PQQ-dependent sugar dehydrogenase, partial [Arenimonas sp.]
MNRFRPLTLSIGITLLAACSSNDPDPRQYGDAPQLPEQQTVLLPHMKIADPAGWGDRRPVVPDGYAITAIATDLLIPRQTLVLPNGDILVAEGRGGHAPKLRPKDLIASKVKVAGTSQVASGNRVTLLRDADGDGTYELKTVFAKDLDAPYGLAYIEGMIYVANQGELVRFAYTDGQTQAGGAPQSVAMLPSVINHHWTKSLVASADGRHLYVGIGSNSNIGERGLDHEENRAMVWEVDVATGAHRQYATGLRNPTALSIQPGTGALWAVANERDELGPNLVPDYLTSVRDGAFYGWPWSYWGNHVDPRARPENPGKVAAAIAPDYSLGSHVAPLGVAFSTPAMGAAFADGAFVGEHG